MEGIVIICRESSVRARNFGHVLHGQQGTRWGLDNKVINLLGSVSVIILCIYNHSMGSFRYNVKWLGIGFNPIVVQSVLQSCNATTIAFIYCLQAHLKVASIGIRGTGISIKIGHNSWWNQGSIVWCQSDIIWFGIGTSGT